MYSRCIHEGVLVHEHLGHEYLLVDTFPSTGLEVLDLLRLSESNVLCVDPYNKVVSINGQVIPSECIRHILADKCYTFTLDVPFPDMRTTGTELCGVVIKFMLVYTQDVTVYILDHSTLSTMTLFQD